MSTFLGKTKIWVYGPYVLGKYPVGNDFIKVSPLLGFGYLGAGEWGAIGFLLGGRIEAGVTELIYLRSEYLYCLGMVHNDGASGATSLKIGGGLDIGLGERKEWYIRPELMYNFSYATFDDYQFVYDGPIGDGFIMINRIDIRCGIGYKFGGNKKNN